MTREIDRISNVTYTTLIKISKSQFRSSTAPTQPEYLFREESVRQRQSWGENLIYYTGCGYLAGAAKGFVEGSEPSSRGDTLKIRVNRGNWAGVIGLMYAGIESGIVAVGDTDDVLNSVAAGLATGAIHKAASGPRVAALLLGATSNSEDGFLGIRGGGTEMKKKG
ncbi:hypothetical protein Cgig2_003512 [Carnegiea gigantea]|uniref:Uncharacterized protein n=1 Tax=Carnegiea gigantea TaxID=171969 RepID=A0A9Q1H096_9CARY|nr:hypothetical protein Cgig2_003512 [Carnegiea gigantea]